MRQQVYIQQHFRRGNAASHPDCRAALRLPLRNLVDVYVELPRQIGQCLLALQRSQCHLCLECRAVIPAHAFRHRLS